MRSQKHRRIRIKVPYVHCRKKKIHFYLCFLPKKVKMFKLVVFFFFFFTFLEGSMGRSAPRYRFLYLGTLQAHPSTPRMGVLEWVFKIRSECLKMDLRIFYFRSTRPFSQTSQTLACSQTYSQTSQTRSCSQTYRHHKIKDP